MVTGTASTIDYGMMAEDVKDFDKYSIKILLDAC
jgi:hypothetical protein